MYLGCVWPSCPTPLSPVPLHVTARSHINTLVFRVCVILIVSLVAPRVCVCVCTCWPLYSVEVSHHRMIEIAFHKKPRNARARPTLMTMSHFPHDNDPPCKRTYFWHDEHLLEFTVPAAPDILPSRHLQHNKT